MAMPQPLVIVESPAKARTIAGYLGDDYTVESSIGHIRDLPANAADVPAAYKAEGWSRLGVDVENDFKPLYVVNADKKKHVTHLKKLLKNASELYLATDEDREGEAIAWHLLEVLNPTVPVHRMVFHEITPAAIEEAIDNPRELDRRLVDAQEARRILDRLYGYEVSPVLWKKVMPRLSAGRVQSVATRMVVERERERMAFVAASYWDLEGTFDKTDASGSFTAKLMQLDGLKIATGRDFGSDGRPNEGVAVLDHPGASGLADELQSADFAVRSVETKPYRRRPAPPFMTSTLQQEAGRKLRLSSAQTMRAAQALYDQGYITYMRTDSTTLSETALEAARSEITKQYGNEFLPDAPRQYTRKVKNAQEAHEAIRPAGDSFKAPNQVRAEMGGAEARVYDLIWKRTVASQMNDAVGQTVSVRLGAVTGSGRDAEFGTSGTVITHLGFRKAYIEGHDAGDKSGDDASDEGDEEKRLPALTEGDGLRTTDIEPHGHDTQPPARYTEASLVKRLEELGVGRPSTYASIISTVQDRGYVWKKGSALVPSFTAFAVVTLLEEHFSDLVDYAFTAQMEEDLDDIADGTAELVPWLSEFYFGTDDAGLKSMVDERLGEIDARAVNSIPLGVDENGEPIVARVGRYGPYVQRGEDTASIPDDIAPDELTIDKAIEYIEAPKGDKVLGQDPATGLDILAKAGRFGPYVQLGEFEEGGDKPKTASLFQTMDLDTVTLDSALELLSLPRVVGQDPADGIDIQVQNGRYGPYLSKEKETRSIDTEEQLLTITLDDCLKLLAEPKRRKGQQRRSTEPLKELGNDPNSEQPVVVKDGRWGPYVTDGDVNASLRKGDTVENITTERAAELLQDRRDRGPAKKKKAPAKKKT